MLDFIRKRKQSWIIKILLAAIVLVFVLWGVGSYMASPQREYVAEVNGEPISLRDFQIHYDRLVEYYRDQFKDNFTPELMKALNLRKTLVDELIERRLLVQEASRRGFEVTDEELIESLASVPEFQVGGRFNRDRYRQFLRSKGLTPAEFETEQRNQLAIKKVYDLVQSAAHVSEAEVKDRYRVEQERINLYFIRLPAESFVAEVKVAPEEVQYAYTRDRETFKEPPQVQVEYLSYPYAQFFSNVQVSPDEIADFYKARQGNAFQRPMSIRVRHILFRVPAEASSQKKEEIRRKAESVLREARSGADFARLAKEHSDDPSSAQGGDVGWLTKGQVIPALEQAAFALKPREISGLLESPGGYHILRIDERREAKSGSLEEAREEIVHTLRIEKAKAETLRALDLDREKILSGTELSQVAKVRGLPITVSPFFPRGVTLPDVGPVQEFYTMAFTLSANEVSRPVEGAAAYYLMKIKGKKESSIPPLDSVRARLEKNLQTTKALELAVQKGNVLLSELKKEKDVRGLSQRHGLKVEETGLFTRSATQIPKIGVLQEVKGGALHVSAYQPVPDRIYTQKDAVFLLAFKESREADLEQFEKEKTHLREQALTEKKQRVVQRLLEDLKSRARVVPNARFAAES